MINNTVYAEPLECADIAQFDYDDSLLETACFDPDNGYGTGVTDKNWEYLRCFEDGRDDCVSKGGPRSRCCQIPEKGKPGGVCYSSEEGRNKAITGTSDQMRTFGDWANESCKWYELGCLAKKMVGTFVLGVTGSMVEDNVGRGKISGAVYACNKGAEPVTREPSCLDLASLSCEIPTQPDPTSSDPSCWCADNNRNVELSPLANMCINHFVGSRGKNRHIEIVPDGFRSEVTITDNLTKRVKDDVNDFFGPDEMTTAFLKWREQYHDVVNILTVDFSDTRTIKKIRSTYPRMFGEEWNDDTSVHTPLSIPGEVAKSKSWRHEYLTCLACAKYSGYSSALGCIPIDTPAKFIAEFVLGIGVGIAGSVAMLGLIVSAIQFQLSQGDSAKIQKIQKQIVQFGTGFLLIIFGTFILRFIGVNILQIYGLG